jgi:hypothetical protein
MFAPILWRRRHAVRGLAGRIFFAGQSLQDFTWEIVGLVVVLVVWCTMPLMVFATCCVPTRGATRYGALASRYVSEFDQKWIRADPPERPLVGMLTSVLADLAGSFEVSTACNRFPSARDDHLLVVATALPVLPLMLTIFPLDELIRGC